MENTKKTTYEFDGVKINVVRPIKPRKTDLKEFYDVCNIIFKGREELFYEMGECKRLGYEVIE